jgi:hypothetical protein
MDDPSHITTSKTMDNDVVNLYHYTLNHKDLPDGLRVLHISDTHFKTEDSTQTEKLSYLAKKTDSLDLVIVT